MTVTKEKLAQRAKLKALQTIVGHRNDDEVEQVIAELRAHLDKIAPPTVRGKAFGFDRVQKGGRNREG